jgi:hypothetical protein
MKGILPNSATLSDSRVVRVLNCPNTMPNKATSRSLSSLSAALSWDSGPTGGYVGASDAMSRKQIPRLAHVYLGPRYCPVAYAR